MLKKLKCLWPNFKKRNGFVVVVAQHILTREVLMIAYANRLAFTKTLETGLAHLWSTSRNELWLKGKTSGDILYVKKILIDCDGDAVVYLVEPKGNTCHTKQKSCFYRDVIKDVDKTEFPARKEKLKVIEIAIHQRLLEKEEENG